MVTAPGPAIPELVQKAFAAQVGGRLLEATECYEAVLKRDPLHFDATHMLGVVAYHRGRFDDALRLLKRAVELGPHVAEARDNLDIVQSARRRESELCRGVLPRLAPLVKRVDDLAQVAAGASALHLVIMQSLSTEDEAFVKAIITTSGCTPLHRWKDPRAPDYPDARAIALAGGAHPEGGVLVLFGSEFSPVAWLDRAAPELSLLVVTRDEPGQLIDRIRELSGEGSRQVGVLCCGAALARGLPFPAEVIVAQATPAPEAGQ